MIRIKLNPNAAAWEARRAEMGATGYGFRNSVPLAAHLCNSLRSLCSLWQNGRSIPARRDSLRPLSLCGPSDRFARAKLHARVESNPEKSNFLIPGPKKACRFADIPNLQICARKRGASRVIRRRYARQDPELGIPARRD